MTGPGVQADQAWRGGWGRERSVTTGPGPTLLDFDLIANWAWRGGWGRERFITTGPSPALPDFDLTGTRSRLPAQISIASSLTQR